MNPNSCILIPLNTPEALKCLNTLGCSRIYAIPRSGSFSLYVPSCELTALCWDALEIKARDEQHLCAADLCIPPLLSGEDQLHWCGDGPCLFKGMFVLLCITADQVLCGALQSELNSSPPLLPGWQGQVGRAELSQGVPSCG